jgi:membrane associated rhomboid family serine protease
LLPPPRSRDRCLLLFLRAPDLPRLHDPDAGQFRAFPATVVLIAINLIAYGIEVAGGPGGINNPGNKFVGEFALNGFFVAEEGEWYRLITGGFLHANFFPHLLFNMVLLFFLGRLLEPALGTLRFVAVYFASLLAGSFGALLLTDPTAFTLGASGAIFGLAGAIFVIARGRGMDAVATEIGFLIVLNLVFTFGAANISVGGHLGGLVGGVLCALAIVAGERGSFGPRRLPAEMLVILAVAAISVAGALAVA